tara:strand:+ start:219 stop:842 length:624 start_codon:yes stop_codon:yes gene_type:complete
MRIVALSDIHNQYTMKIPDGDVLIFAGDISYLGKLWDITKFNKWLGTLPHEHKLYIPGNHDALFEKEPLLAESIVSNGVQLTPKVTKINGVTFAGSPITPVFSKWSFQMGSAARRVHFSQLPKVDVLVTHGPPKTILDQNAKGENCGCEWLLQEVSLRIKPKVHIFGHIHEGSGHQRQGDTDFYNVCILNEDQEAVHEATVINLERS